MPQGLSLGNFKAALFDVDGTLVDSMEMIVRGLGDTFERYTGKRPSGTRIQSMIGLPLQRQFSTEEGGNPSDSLLREMMDYAISRFDEHESLERTFDSSIEVLRLCRLAGIKTALVTSKSATELESFMNRFVGAQYVDVTVCASEVLNPKPHPESALLACRRLGVRPSEAVMIGDSIYDVRCARGAGATAIAVGYGCGATEALLAEDPDAFYRTPEALLEWARDEFLVPTCPERK